MIPFLIDGPQLEPVSLAEARAWLRVDGNEEDSLIQALIIAARLTLESEAGLVMIAQNWRIIADEWPAGELIPVRIGRVISVAGGRVFPANGVPEVLASAEIPIVKGAERDSLQPLRRPAPGRARGGIEIDVRLGFGEFAGSVPESLRLAIRLLLTHWFENRGESWNEQRGLPPAIAALVRPFRQIRL